MIKKLSIIAAILVITATAMAQTTESDKPANTEVDFNAQQKITLGFVAAPNISWFGNNDKNINSDGSVVGFKFGLSGNFYFAKNYAFNTGLYLNTLGGSLVYNNGADMNIGGVDSTLNPGAKVQYNITYIEVPLSLKLQTPDFNRFVYFGRFGFSPMFRTRARTGDKLDLSDEVSWFNMNYHIGGGFEYFISGNTALSFSMIYNQGIIDVTKDNSGRTDHSTLSHVDFIVGINF